jgi:hypothetical protein
MRRSILISLLVAFTVLTANADDEGPRRAQTGENLDNISEFNRAWWHWRRCVAKYEQVHGASQDGKPPELCGPEPLRAKAQKE